ncbi:acyl-coa-binding domain-containing protein 5 [Nicotiana attenuata]|uniref:Acyl-coa-binding domain-containing protein 5 n=1 Tax=Nicotiana attenuata TaxID=49451 RepID=A0A1J6J800_NICAT|nr:acyl-coa-binding domain-containing protein 5 [Nicotiana attenuata]
MQLSRGGHSVTLAGTSLVIFGGQDANRSLLNDLHILDLETMTWDEMGTLGVPPSPRSDHAAAVHAERYLLIFGR